MRRIAGPALALRLITPQDAAYIAGLRADPQLTRHLSAGAVTLQSQRDWIRAYRQREARGAEYYYIALRQPDGQPCGTVRLYDITPQRFTWGSWILDAAKPPKAALACAALSFWLGFERLGCPCAQLDVRRDNARAIALYRRFGMEQTGETDLDILFAFDRAAFHRVLWPAALAEGVVDPLP